MSIALDHRIRTGLPTILNVAELARIWRDHCPADLPTPQHCPGCGFDYLTGPLCPTAALVRPLVRPLLRTRRHSAQDTVLDLLTYQQFRDLIDKQPITDRAFAAQRRTLTATADPAPGQLDLFGGTR
jgi:hypothetical protein